MTTIIHDFDQSVMRCEDCHKTAIDRGDIPRRKVFQVWEHASTMRYMRDDEGIGFCDECGA